MQHAYLRAADACRCKEVGDFDTCLRIWEEAVGKGIDMGRQGNMLLVEAAMQVAHSIPLPQGMHLASCGLSSDIVMQLSSSL